MTTKSLIAVLSGDLKHPRWMFLKAALFLVAGLVSVVVLFAESPTLRTAFLLVIAVWSFARLYYFFFYVIEKYIDPGYRFDGMFSALRYLCKRQSQPAQHAESQARGPFAD